MATAQTSTDLDPELARQLAAKWGLRWGGDWTGATRDPMHFEVPLPPGASGALPPTPELATVATPSGIRFQVAKQYADRFQGFVNDLAATGYQFDPASGGYNRRFIAGTQTSSEHALGAAIDVNPDKNPQGGGVMPASTTVDQLGGAGGGYNADMVNRTMGDVAGLFRQKEALQAPIIEDMQKRFKEDQIRFDKTAEDYTPIKETQPPPPPPTDPLKGFASAGAIFAALASGFTHTPAINAMNGMAAAINATKRNDWEQYEAGYRQWKDNTEIAIQHHKLQAEDMRNAMEMMQSNLSAGVAMAKAVAAQTDDQISMRLLELGEYGKLANHQLAVTRAAEEMQRSSLEVERLHQDLTERKAQTDAAAELSKATPGTPEYDAAFQKVISLAAIHNPEILVHQAGGVPGSPGFIIKQMHDQIRADDPSVSDGEAWSRATQQYNESKSAGGKPSAASYVTTKDGQRVLAQQLPSGQWVTADEHRTPIEGVTGIEKVTTQSTLRQERDTRFADAKKAMQADGSYRNDSQVWDKVNHEMFISKTSQFSAGTAEMLADQIIAGNAQAASGFGRSPSLLAQLDAALAKRMAEHDPPLTGADLARIKVEYAAYAQGVKAFEAGGKLEPTVRSLSVVTDHLDTLQQAATALAKNDVQTLNAMQNRFNAEFGSTGPVTFNAIKGIVAAEIEKAVTGSAGAVTDREDLKENLKASLSPSQLSNVIGGYEALMVGQIGGVRQTYTRMNTLVNQPAKNFDENFLSPRTQQIVKDVTARRPPVPGAMKALDGKWYVRDPDRPGKYLEVQQ